MWATFKNFIFSSTDYWDYKLGAVFLAFAALPLSDVLGLIIKALACLTGIALLVKATYNALNAKLQNKKTKLENQKLHEEIEALKSIKRRKLHDS